MVSWIPESSCFRTPFWSQRVNGSKTLLKSARWCFHPSFLLMLEKLSTKTCFLVKSEILGLCFYPSFPLMSDKSSTKRSLLVRSEISGLCFNRLTGNHMYSHLNWEILQQQVQKHLSRTAKIFYFNFIAFLKST